jgi:hypothetical protein
MDLIGKHVLMILSEAGAAVFFAFPAPASFDPARRWGIGGKVVGEMPGIGLWVTKESTFPPGLDAIHDGQAEEPYLFRWEWIVTICPLKKHAADVREMGFRFPVAPQGRPATK